MDTRTGWKFRRLWLKSNNYFAIAIGVVGYAFILAQTLSYAEHLPTIVWDESMYLYKGYLFATGRYLPFEDFGPWTNQLPISFLIPGYIQKWFGPGMQTGRMYAVIIGALAVLGLWATVYRNSNAWLASATVWVVALNPAYVQVFSQSFAQSLVSMLFAWMLFFGLGKKRRNWELALSSFLIGLAGMARVNVLLVLPIFVMYVFWEHGRRLGWVALVSGLLPIIGLHVLYWPDILKFWAYWIPSSLFPSIESFRSPWREIFLPETFSWLPLSGWINNPDHLAWIGIRTLGQAIRVNFVVIFGVIISIIMWPWRKFSQKQDSIWDLSRYKQFVFLLTTFIVLFAVHLWAANGHSCQFVCLPGYIMFFFVFGLVLIPLSTINWHLEKSTRFQVVLVVLIFVLLLVLEYNYANPYLDFRYDLIQNTFDVAVPRIKDGRIVEGTGMLWELLENKFGFNHFPLRQFILSSEIAIHLVRWIKIVGLVAVVTPIAFFLWRKLDLPSVNFGSFSLLFILAVCMLSSRSRMFGGFLTMQTCQDSVINSYEHVGADLKDLIPPNSQIYWNVKANMLLLYLPEVEIFTPQLNAGFTYIEDSDADTRTLYRFGWWNPVLKQEWIQQADYILVEKRLFNSEWEAKLDSGQLEQVYLSEPVASCRGDGSRIVVLAPSNSNKNNQ